MTVETIDSHLCESTVLTVVLRAHARLEVESLRQAGALCDVKKFSANHVHQVWCHSSCRLVPIGGNHYLVETQVVWGKREIKFLAGVMANGDASRLGVVAHVGRLDDEGPLRQVLEEEMSVVVAMVVPITRMVT